MSILNQFMDSSIAVTEQIALMIQENERLKKRVLELEKSEQQKSKPHICDLMPVDPDKNWLGEFIVREVNKSSTPIRIGSSDPVVNHYLSENSARAIYEAHNLLVNWGEMIHFEMQLCDPLREDLLPVPQWIIDEVTK